VGAEAAAISVGALRAPIVIRPSRGWASLRLADVWTYRELLAFLVWRDLKVRYKQTVLGVAWAVLQPVLTMLLFSVVFGRLAKMPSNGLPYPVFAFCALLPWQFFANALTASANSLVTNQQLITKVYFPRLVIPLSALGAGLVDLAIAFVVLLGVMGWYGFVPSLRALALPLFLLLTMVTVAGVGLWLSALNVKYRDIRYTLPLLTQLWLFATPIAYPTSLVPEHWRALFGLNPMAAAVEGFRWCLLGRADGLERLIVPAGVVALVLLASGLYYFRATERQFADIV